MPSHYLVVSIFNDHIPRVSAEADRRCTAGEKQRNANVLPKQKNKHGAAKENLLQFIEGLYFCCMVVVKALISNTDPTVVKDTSHSAYVKTFMLKKSYRYKSNSTGTRKWRFVFPKQDNTTIKHISVFQLKVSSLLLWGTEKQKQLIVVSTKRTLRRVRPVGYKHWSILPASHMNTKELLQEGGANSRTFERFWGYIV